MKKTKTIILFSLYEDRYRFRIQLRVTRSGALRGSANIVIDDNTITRGRNRDKARGFGFKAISFRHPETEWHHIDKERVVSCPAWIHNEIPHSIEDGSALRLEGILG